jgi:hypothetical protein
MIYALRTVCAVAFGLMFAVSLALPTIVSAQLTIAQQDPLPTADPDDPTTVPSSSVTFSLTPRGTRLTAAMGIALQDGALSLTAAALDSDTDGVTDVFTFGSGPATGVELALGYTHTFGFTAPLASRLGPACRMLNLGGAGQAPCQFADVARLLASCPTGQEAQCQLAEESLGNELAPQAPWVVSARLGFAFQSLAYLDAAPRCSRHRLTRSGPQLRESAVRTCSIARCWR